LGTHTYFKLPLSPGGRFEDCELIAPAHELWVLDNNLPTGEIIGVPPDKDMRLGRPISRGPLDDVYTDVRPANGKIDCVIRDSAAGLEIVQSTDPIFRELVAFTPPNRQAVCMEPYTCVSDAINVQHEGVDTGLQILPPGEEITTWIDIEVRPIPR
jgi:aldose 1-epimerase